MIVLSLVANSVIATASTSEFKTENYFNSIKNNPQKLADFLQKMPKGGDLHNHLGGASMAENMLQYGKNDQLCIDTKTYTASHQSTCTPDNHLATAPQHPTLYNAVIDAWSMRNFHPGNESGHDHFFATFGKYNAISSQHSGEMLTEVVGHAGEQNESYLEIMVTPDNNASGMLGKKIGWDPNLAQLREKLLKGGLKPIIASMSKKLNSDEAALQSTLECKSAYAKAGCDITVRYLYQVLREQPPAQVFAQLLAGFELANQDPHVVGINMVQPEDGAIAMRDYKLHMQMVAFLHHLYPHVHITLHAGELIPGLVPADGLQFHIRDAVETAHATRIGHGVDITYEKNSEELIHEMAQKHIMVEINLISNDEILDVKGKQHPITIYMNHAVPVALSTDDEGVLRTKLTDQYQRAARDYQLSYHQLKNLVRNSLYYSFISGKNLWKDDSYQHVVSECADETSVTCKNYLNANEKAKLQWSLEKRFKQFERNIGN